MANRKPIFAAGPSPNPTSLQELDFSVDRFSSLVNEKDYSAVQSLLIRQAGALPVNVAAGTNTIIGRNGGDLRALTPAQGLTVLGAMETAVYDPAGIAEQLLGLTATQTITGKTLSDFSNEISANHVHEEVRNESGGVMARGDAVFVSGYSIGQNMPLVTLADASAGATMPGFAIIESATVANNANGDVVQLGHVDNMDTSAWTSGDALYVSSVGTTGNTLTNVKPIGTDLIQPVAIVLRSHATLGIIEVLGPGVANDLPNLLNDNVWVGNGSGVPVAIAIPTSQALQFNGTAFAQAALADLSDVTAKTGTGTTVVMQGEPTITTPRIAEIRDANGAEAMTFATTASALNNLRAVNTATGNSPRLAAQGEADRGLRFDDSNGGQLLNLRAVPSAVTFLRVTSAVTGAGPTIDSQGEANAPLTLLTPGTGDILLDAGGNVLWRSGALVAIQVPIDVPANGDVLTVLSAAGDPVTTEWSPPGGGTTHNILSATHIDTVTATVVRGDLMVGNVTPLWDRLAVGALNTYLQGGADPAYVALDITDDAAVSGFSGTGTVLLRQIAPNLQLPTIDDAGGDELLRFVEAGTPANFIEIANANASARPQIRSAGTDTNIGLTLVTKGTGGIDAEDDAGNRIFRFQNISGAAVNFVNVINALTTVGPTISSAGEANVPLTITTIGTGDLLLTTAGAGTVQYDGDEVVTLGKTQTLTLKTLTTPTIGDFSNAEHTHAAAGATGGQIAIADTTGTLAISRGGTGQTAQTPAFDALSPLTTAGDVIFHNGSDNVRLAIGTAHQHLRTNAGATAPEWYDKEEPARFALEDPVSGDIFGFEITNKAITVTEIQAICDNGTSVVVNVRQHTSIAAGGGTLIDQITPTTSVTSETTISSAAVPADRVIFCELGTVTGSVDSVTVKVYYTED